LRGGLPYHGLLLLWLLKLSLLEFSLLHISLLLLQLRLLEIIQGAVECRRRQLILLPRSRLNLLLLCRRNDHPAVVVLSGLRGRLRLEYRTAPQRRRGGAGISAR
jgi:hypothetical protein